MKAVKILVTIDAKMGLTKLSTTAVEIATKNALKDYFKHHYLGVDVQHICVDIVRDADEVIPDGKPLGKPQKGG